MPEEIHVNYNFLVEISGVEAGAFSEVSGLGVEVQVIEYRDGSEPYRTPRKLPGMRKYSNITLKRGVVRGDSLHEWLKAVLNGRADRREGSIILLNEEREEVMRWSFRRGWICKYEGPELAGNGNDVAIETLEICHEGLELAD